MYCSECGKLDCQWTPANEQLLQNVSDSAKLWAHLHSMATRYQHKMSLSLGSCIVAFNALTTSAMFFSTTQNCSNDNLWVKYVASAISLTGNIFVGIYATLQPLVHCAEHLSSEKVATGIYDELNRVIASDHSRRADPNSVITIAQNALTEIRDNPRLPIWITSKYSDELYDFCGNKCLSKNSKNSKSKGIIVLKLATPPCSKKSNGSRECIV